MEKLAGGLAGVGLAVYLIMVAANGNTKTLGSLLKEDAGYLEFLIALYALHLLRKYGPAQKITDALIVTAVIAVIVKAFTNSNIGSILNEFGSGQKSMLETVQAILGYEV